MHIVLLGIAFGVLAMGIGGLITIIIGRRSDITICSLLAFAGGIMSSIAFFELIPEAIMLTDNIAGNVYIVAGGIVLGVVGVLTLNMLFDRMTDSDKNKKIHETYEELHHQTALIEKSKANKKLFRSGIVMLIAITLHNFPEGLAIGAAGSYEADLAIRISILMAIHNIPEGMAVAAPLLSAGVKKWKVMAWCMLSAVPIIFGGLIGYYLGTISDIVQAVCLAVAGGAMLYIVFGEIIPQSVTMTKSRLPTIIALIGIVVGLFITHF